MSKTVEVLVFGSANIDYFTYVQALPSRGETVQGSKFEISYGGKGANQCVAARRLGAKAALVAKVGGDTPGADYISYLRGLKINVEFVDQMKGYTTGVAHVAVAEGGDNHIIIVPGANALLNSRDVIRAKNLFAEAPVLLCQLETNATATATALKEFKGISILNAAPAPKEMLPELYSLPSIFVVNAVEAAQLTERAEIKTPNDAYMAAKDLLAKGTKSVIITLGKQGAIYMSKDEQDRCVHVPAQEVTNVVDTTGAGDAFLGGLAYHLARFPNLPRERHISAAHAIAAYSIQREGAQPSFPGEELAMNNLCMVEVQFNELGSFAPPS